MIVVTASTGDIGQQLLKSLLNRGPAVRVIVRNSSKLPSDIRDRVESQMQEVKRVLQSTNSI